MRCVGVPVYNSAGKLVAGVSTSGPAITMTDEKLMECAGILQNAALRCGAHLPLSPPHRSVFYVCLPSSPEDAGTYRNKKETKRDK